jgi:6-phosphofructokinase 1
VRQTLESLRVDGLIAIGGEDTVGAANHLHGDGTPVLGVPKTIDNDLGATDQTFRWALTVVS